MKESQNSYKNLHNLFDLHLATQAITEIHVDSKRL